MKPTSKLRINLHLNRFSLKNTLENINQIILLIKHFINVLLVMFHIVLLLIITIYEIISYEIFYLILILTLQYDLSMK